MKNNLVGYNRHRRSISESMSDFNFKSSVSKISLLKYFELNEYGERKSKPKEITLADLDKDQKEIYEILKKEDSKITKDEIEKVINFSKDPKSYSKFNIISQINSGDRVDISTDRLTRILNKFEFEEGFTASKPVSEKAFELGQIADDLQKVFPKLQKLNLGERFNKILSISDTIKDVKGLEQQIKSLILSLKHEEDTEILARMKSVEDFVKNAVKKKQQETGKKANIDALLNMPSPIDFSASKQSGSSGVSSYLKKLFGIKRENYDIDKDLLSDQIVMKMVKNGHIESIHAIRRAKSLIREMLEDNEYMSHMDQHDHMDNMEHMGPSETGVFDAPDEEHPGYMLLGNLKKLAVKAGELADLASPWDDAEPWIESKINSAAEHIDAIHDYIMYSVLDQDFDALGHEQMMYECGEMMGDVMVDGGMHDQVMTEPHTHGRHFGDGGSAQMARGQLFLIAKKAQSLSDRLSDDDTLPEWLQSKIAMAYQTIAMISDYMEYKMNYPDSPHAV